MTPDLHTQIDERKRFILQMSEFNFATYPVQINHVNGTPDSQKKDSAVSPKPGLPIFRVFRNQRFTNLENKTTTQY